MFFCFYSIIKKHGNVLDIYSKQLIDEGIVTREEVTEVIDKYEKICEEAYKKAGTEKQVRYVLDVSIFLIFLEKFTLFFKICSSSMKTHTSGKTEFRKFNMPAMISQTKNIFNRIFLKF